MPTRFCDRFLFFFILVTVSILPLSSAPPFVQTEKDPDQAVEEILKQMNEEEILGQLFLVGYSSTEPSPLIIEWIRRRGLGGVKIFGWNAEDLQILQKSIQRMQNIASSNRLGIPLFIATDQEGGWVRHVKGDTSITPGNLALGATRIPYDSYRTGYFIGKELKSLGINMNFAPTVDVYANPDAHVIGPRAFSSDPVLTGILGIAYFKGMVEAGVIPTAKHFPGHGNADIDSHGALPILYDSLETLWKRDLVPYRLLISENIPAILSGHLSFPRITGNKQPSSLSPFFGIELLRKQLGFKGILITDDLYMSGANRGKPMEDICIQALEAGNDLLMLSQTPQLNDPIWRALTLKYRTEPAFKERVHQAVQRILLIKYQYLNPGTQEKSTQLDLLNKEESREFFFEQAARSVTLFQNRSALIPYTPAPKEKILLAGPFKEYLKIGQQYFPDAEVFQFSYSPFYHALPEDKKALQQKASKVDTVIFCLANLNGLELLKTLKNYSGKIIAFSVLTPVYLRDIPWIDAAIAVYGWGGDSFKAGFSAITGKIPALGKNPIEALLTEKEP